MANGIATIGTVQSDDRMLGYALALSLLFGSYYLSWSFVVFPLWVLVMSVYILMIQEGGPHTDAAPVQNGLNAPDVTAGSKRVKR
jgi:hypothetical protein